MKDCFIIMPFTPELNSIYEECYKPIIQKNNLNPIVLTETRNGSPVYSQIVTNIQNSYLIIADLSIARPNCYFEVGYAIGQGKQDNLIMCCREDHSLESSNNPRYIDKGVGLFKSLNWLLPKKIEEKFSFYLKSYLDQHKIHFDLAGYNIIFWSHDKKNDFKVALDKEIKQRLGIISLLDQTIGTPATKPLVTRPTIPTLKRMSQKEIEEKFKTIEQQQVKELKNVKK